MRWIHIDDQVPPKHTPVLIYNFETGYIRLATWSENQWKATNGSTSIVHAPYWAPIDSFPTEYVAPKIALHTSTRVKARPWKPIIKSTNTTTVKS